MVFHDGSDNIYHFVIKELAEKIEVAQMLKMIS